MANAITDYYDSYDEEGRLSRDNGHQIEWITTMAYFKKLFKPEAYILDGCAGTGNYSFHWQNWGIRLYLEISFLIM